MAENKINKSSDGAPRSRFRHVVIALLKLALFVGIGLLSPFAYEKCEKKVSEMLVSVNPNAPKYWR